MKIGHLLTTAFFAAAMTFNSSVYAQVKIGTNPTTIGATNNLEVEASTTGRKTSIDKTTGQVTIADGTQGSNKLLTSDANGASSWQSPSTLNIPITAFTAYNSANVVITTSTTGAVSVPFSVTNPTADWNATTNEYTILEAGIYRLEFNAIVDNVSLSPGKTYYGEFVAIVAGSKNASYALNPGSVNWGPNMFLTSYFAGGEKVKVQVASYNPAGVLIVDQLTFKGANITITKVQ